MVLSRTKLEIEEVSERLVELPHWTLENGQLTRDYKFSSYADGVIFATAVAHLAERLDHHPEIIIGYRQVHVSVSTHDADGLTDFDFELARRADWLVSH